MLLRRLLRFLRRAYLLRVPLLTALGIAGFCFAAIIWPPGLKLLLGNAFDISSFWGIFAVSLIAFLAGWIVMVNWRLVRLYGHERFCGVRAKANRVLRWRDLLPYAVIPLVVMAGVAVKSLGGLAGAPGESAEFWWWIVKAVPAALAGLLISLLCLAVVAVGQLLFTRRDYARLRTEDGAERRIPDLFLPLEDWPMAPLIEYVGPREPVGKQAEWIAGFLDRRLSANGGHGYVRRDEDGKVGSLLPGQGAAFVLFLLTIFIYLAIGLWGYNKLGGVSPIPTLCYLLLLAILLCWTFSGMAFFLDRYRIPVLVLPVALLLVAASCSIGPDYYYPVLENPPEVASQNAATGNEKSSGGSIIVVAANGGGIQASAWTARVLTGLEKKCRDTEGCGNHFGTSIRLISSVSGGSVGTMYFVNEYEEGNLPEDEEELDRIVGRAGGSSLDQVAWGLLYPDLARTLNPTPYVLSPLLGWDRGRAMEKAWSREDTSWPRREGIKEGLSEWRKDADDFQRPAVIFNTTIAETGQRLPLATTDLPPESPGGKSYNELFDNVTPRPDIRVVTAARLSASFPYVSPAARADVDEREQAHLVDGGYYDNYGVSSLVEWLDWKLEKQLEEDSTEEPKISKVLIVEIRGAPSADDPDSKSDQG
ncbi:MAG TPA: patatin-like phospholipase family protein, partial [Rubrobacter sp.]|nr:patatin-like phospholipase family protein [Rubrobacter sp.]